LNLILAPGDPSSGRRKNSSPVPKPSGSPAALLFIRPSTADSAFQACIDQFEIKDGNRLRNSGSAAYEQYGPQRHAVRSGDEAGLHGWNGRRAGRGAHLLTGGRYAGHLTIFSSAGNSEWQRLCWKPLVEGALSAHGHGLGHRIAFP
jgi:hypothetical protein